MELQRVPAGFRLRRGRSVRGLELVLRRIQHGARVSDLIELEKGLDFFRALRWFDKDEAEDLAAGKRDFRVVRDFGQNGLDVVIGGKDLWFLRRRNLAGDRRRFVKGGQEDLQLDERRIGKFGLIDMRAMFRNGKAFGPPSGEASNLAGEPEFDSVHDAAFAGPIGT